MNLRQYLLSKPEAQEDFPFGPEAAVFKVQGKMFALLGQRQGRASLNLKCDPQQAIGLRDLFPAVTPGYHMNKRHWNSVFDDGSIPPGEMQRMIDHSYALVVKGLARSQRLGLEARHGKAALYAGGAAETGGASAG
ncbi:MAG: MmcQ/YjbR family DNA-binding protein [Halopseudomonas sp.]|uniref:MmcQ/YjbR family DNA-binding protein n=1 Tax=Halopseudomonas sp. TaxID=2901191 RepID=UPI0030034659